MTHRRFPKLILAMVPAMMALALPAWASPRDAHSTFGSARTIYTSPRDIEQAQAILVQDGELAPGSYTQGQLDEATASALRLFQSRHALNTSGLLDDETMALLLSHWQPNDADGDGVTDDHDRCPDTPAGATVDGHGCPQDSDHDGVLDGLDACPGTLRGAYVDSRGCPTDSDRDGVYDGLDKCPDTPKGATVDAKGCPSDADRDGVYDGLDFCPDTPAGRKVDSRGCPEPIKSADVFQGQKKLVLEGVRFETNSAKLTSDSQEILNHVAFSLKDWSDVRVEIGGYTDSTGKTDHNLSLSQARADSVRDYLISQGVKASQLVSKGYGEDDPVASNKSASGRAKNRRVEMTKLD
jgi:outer membrane protein OmpA-like peptidoglycan-associated protein